MKVILLLISIASSVISEAPYPPSGYRPPGPQFELPPRTESPQTDVETFSDTIIIDRQGNQKLWPISQQPPTLREARFRTYSARFNNYPNPTNTPRKLPPSGRLTSLEFYKVPVHLLKTVIDYPSTPSPVVNLRENTLKDVDKSGGTPVGETTENFPSQFATRTAKIPSKNNVKIKTVVYRRKILKPVKNDVENKGDVNQEGFKQHALFVKLQKSNNEHPLQSQNDGYNSQKGGNSEPLDQYDNKPREQSQVSNNYNNDGLSSVSLDNGNDINIQQVDFNSQKVSPTEDPSVSYGLSAITTKKPLRRRKTGRRKLTTTTTTESPSTEEPFSEDIDPNNVAISTAVAGLPAPYYLVQQPQSGQFHLLQLQTQ